MQISHLAHPLSSWCDSKNSNGTVGGKRVKFEILQLSATLSVQQEPLENIIREHLSRFLSKPILETTLQPKCGH